MILKNGGNENPIESDSDMNVLSNQIETMNPFKGISPKSNNLMPESLDQLENNLRDFGLEQLFDKH